VLPLCCHIYPHEKPKCHGTLFFFWSQQLCAEAAIDDNQSKNFISSAAAVLLPNRNSHHHHHHHIHNFTKNKRRWWRVLRIRSTSLQELRKSMLIIDFRFVSTTESLIIFSNRYIYFKFSIQFNPPTIFRVLLLNILFSFVWIAISN
jgi:hypothetical protein